MKAFVIIIFSLDTKNAVLFTIHFLRRFWKAERMVTGGNSLIGLYF